MLISNMSPSETNNQFLEFKLLWKSSKDEFRQLAGSSKPISRRFWTTHNHFVLEWAIEFTTNVSTPEMLDFALQYVDGPSETVRFHPSMVGILSSGNCTSDVIDDDEHQLSRGEKFVEKEFAGICLESGAYVHQIRLLISASSFDSNAKLHTISDSPDSRPWMVNLHSTIENAHSKDSDIRLVSGDKVTFYCHRVILTTQSEVFYAMFRNPRSEEEKNGTFPLPTLTGDELRKVLEYFYIAKIDLESSTIDQLMSVYDFAEQLGLQEFKDVAGAQLWSRVLDSPSECVDAARFAELHGMKSLKLRCFDILLENYSRLGMKVDDMFKEKRGVMPAIDGEPPSKKMRTSGDDKMAKDDEVGNRLKNEFIEYGFGRIESTVLIEVVSEDS